MYKISKFGGRSTDDYNTWRMRAVIALKGKGWWSQINIEKCPDDIKEKATALLVNALGDTALRVCSSELDEPLKMLDLLDARYASDRTSSRISLLTTLYTKRFKDKDNMPKFIDEFETLFGQLERMGEKTKVPETHKAPLLLASLGTNSLLENTVAALRLRDVDNLSWKDVTADIIQEWQQKKDKKTNDVPTKRHNSQCPKSCPHPSHDRFRRRREQANRTDNTSTRICNFCGEKGHLAEDCFSNPNSPRCKLSERAKKSLKAYNTEDKNISSHVPMLCNDSNSF